MYPKIFTHRNDSRSQVVIANAEQEAQLPPEYLPPVTGASGLTVSGADAATAAMLSPEYDALLADREKLERDRTELAEARAALEKDRAELTAGYKASMAQLEEDRARLTEDQRQFDAAKAGGQPEAPPVSTDAATSAPATATPTKRVRTAKAD